jgi:uncharacterized protein YyaL (SSP411 family)
MISGLVAAYKALDDRKSLESAQKAAEFMFHRLHDPDTSQLHRCFPHRAGEKVAGNAQDYSNMIQACLDLYSCDLNSEWLERAKNLQKKQDQLFWDGGDGAYFAGLYGLALISISWS